MFKNFKESCAKYDEVQKYRLKTAHQPYVIRKINRALFLLGWNLSGAHEKARKKCEERYHKLKRNKMIMHLAGEHFDTKFCLPLLHMERGEVMGDLIQRLIFVSEDYFELDTLQMLKEKYMKADMNILDIGANIGNHTLFFVKECNAKHVYSFEPMPKTYEMLCKNIEINGLDNVTLYNTALGSREATVSVKEFNEKNYGGTSLKYGGGVQAKAA